MGHASRALVTVLLGAGLLSVWTPAPPVYAGNSVVTVGSDGNVGWFTSVVLDGAGNPVVSYYDLTNRDLKLVHCDDGSCAGRDESIVTVDSDGNVGLYSSVVLDGAGNPVVSYYDDTDGHLKLVHCDDPSCFADESIVTVDGDRLVGRFTSLVLDGAGNPVISYHDDWNSALKLVRCNDPSCDGGDESIVTVDSAGDVGEYTSLELDGGGNPVVSYHDHSNGDLKLVHCNDPSCAGGGESVVTVDSAGDVGEHTSVVSDGADNPVVSYHDHSNGDLKLVQCNDPNCAGGGESIVTVDSDGDVGDYSSLALDGGGNPVVSYYDSSHGDLKVAHCDRPACVDVIAPVTSIDTDPVSSDGANGWYRSAVTVSPSGRDDNGVVETRCALNPVPAPVSFADLPAEPCQSLIVAVDGEHTVYAGSIDQAGNTDLVQASVRIDQTAPVTSIGTDPGPPNGANGWYRSAVTVSPSGRDDNGVVETRCALNPVPAPVSFADLPAEPCQSLIVAVDGEHTVYAGSIDQAGNTDLVQDSLRIDQTAPRASITLNPASPDGPRGWYVDPVTVSVTADERLATLRCVVDPAEPPISFAELPEGPCDPFTASRYGQHTVYAAAVDPAGNTGPVVTTAFKSVGALRCNGQIPTHVGTPGADIIIGTPGRDVIVALGGNDVIYGRGGNDMICAGAGDDLVYGGPGNDRIYGGRGKDTLHGGNDRDLLLGGDGNDTLHGGRSNDALFGGLGNDSLDGGPGDDLLDGGAGTDITHRGP